MRKATLGLFLCLAVLFVPCISFAQTAPASPVQHFVISGSAAAFGGNGTASIASSGVQLTSSVSVAYEFISNPADSSKPKIGSGLVNYTRSAASFLPAKVRSKLLFDLTNYNVTFQAGAGRESLAGPIVGGPRTYHVIGNFGIYGGYPLPGGHTQVGIGPKFIVGPTGTTVIKMAGNLVFTF
jgi:hypothetical protein